MNDLPDASRELAGFAATLRYEDIPAPVLDRAGDLFLDWFGSALAGKGARPVESVARFMHAMGPADGPSEVLIDRRGSSPLVAATINAAASHFAEQDDVHNGSVFHPAAVVFPPALAMAQSLGRAGRDLLVAAVAGYEVGIRVGEFLGRSHYRIFHTTGTAGTLAAAAATGRLLGLSPEQMLHAFGSAGTQAAGLWEFLRDGADSKQLHTAHAAGAGLTAACLARRRLHRRQAHPRRRPRAWPRACPAMPIPQSSPPASAAAGHCRRRRSNSTPHAAIPIPRRTRLLEVMRTHRLRASDLEARHGIRASGRDRRARARRRSPDRAPGEVLDGDRAGRSRQCTVASGWPSSMRTSGTGSHRDPRSGAVWCSIVKSMPPIRPAGSAR